MQIQQVIEAAKTTLKPVAQSFVWARPGDHHDRDIPAIEAMIEEVKGLGMETCMTLGMLTESGHQTAI